MEGDPSEDVPRAEHLEFWHRDIVECIKELIGNPLFKDYTHYTPERKYKDEECTERIFDEMWTGELWWQVQVCNER